MFCDFFMARFLLGIFAATPVLQSSRALSDSHFCFGIAQLSFQRGQVERPSKKPTHPKKRGFVQTTTCYSGSGRPLGIPHYP